MTSKRSKRLADRRELAEAEKGAHAKNATLARRASCLPVSITGTQKPRKPDAPKAASSRRTLKQNAALKGGATFNSCSIVRLQEENNASVAKSGRAQHAVPLRKRVKLLDQLADFGFQGLVVAAGIGKRRA